MAYVGLKVPAQIGDLLAQIEVPERREPKEEYHITLLNLGDDVPVEVLSRAMQLVYQAARSTKPFQISTKRVTSFPAGPSGTPVVCAIDSPELHELNAKLRELFDKAEVEYSKKFPDFKPHITLAYSQKPFSDKTIPEVSFTVGGIHLLGGDKGEDKLEVRFPLPMDVKLALRVAARHQRTVLAKKTENYLKLEAILKSIEEPLMKASGQVSFHFNRKVLTPEQLDGIARDLSGAAREALKGLKLEFEDPSRAKSLQKYLTRFKNLTKMIGEWMKGDTWAELEPTLKGQATKSLTVWQKYLQYRDEALAVVGYIDAEQEGHIDVAGWNVALWSVDKGDWDDNKTEALLWILRQTSKVLASIGMGGVIGGKVYAYPSKSLPGATGSHGANASYRRDVDRMHLALGGNSPARILQSMVHECGHRAYWKLLSTGGRERWDSFFDEQSGPPDVDTLIKEWETFAQSEHTGTAVRRRHFYDFHNYLEQKDAEAATWLEIIESKMNLTQGEKLNSYSGTPVKGDKPALDTLIEHRDKVKVFLHPVTAYSATSSGELFAEVFAHYALYGAGRIPEIVRDMFGRVLPQFRR